LVVSAISESIRLDATKLEQAFTGLAEKHVKGEITGGVVEKKEDRITGERLEEEAEEASVEVTGEVVKPNNKEQIAITAAAAARKGKLTKPRNKEEKIPESLRKNKKQDQSQMTLDKVAEDAKPKGRKSK
jgi:hypothetical protein